MAFDDDTVARWAIAEYLGCTPDDVDLRGNSQWFFAANGRPCLLREGKQRSTEAAFRWFTIAGNVIEVHKDKPR